MRLYPEKPQKVYYFGTCLADMFYPEAGMAGIKLIQQQGVKVIYPSQQSCCGQPAYNAGDMADSRAVARGVIDVFEGYDYVVAPSGSCAGMIREHYPALFEDEPETAHRAHGLARRTYELVSFLRDVRWEPTRG